MNELLRELQNESCPCRYTTPCDERCSCVHPFSSRGCARCCRYGSLEQRKKNAERIAALVSPDELALANARIDYLMSPDSSHSQEGSASKWVSCGDRMPASDDICFISDGKDVGLATYSPTYKSWRGCGFGGYEWDWDFEPTHWMAVTLKLPTMNKEQP